MNTRIAIAIMMVIECSLILFLGYSSAMVQEMAVICRDLVQPITFPVRTPLVRQSIPELAWLLQQSNRYDVYPLFVLPTFLVIFTSMQITWIIPKNYWKILFNFVTLICLLKTYIINQYTK